MIVCLDLLADNGPEWLQFACRGPAQSLGRFMRVAVVLFTSCIGQTDVSGPAEVLDQQLWPGHLLAKQEHFSFSEGHWVRSLFIYHLLLFAYVYTYTDTCMCLIRTNLSVFLILSH